MPMDLFASFCSAAQDLPARLSALAAEGVEPAVCFTGHRVLPPEDLNALSALISRAVREAYALGFRAFYCGAALGFDLLAGFTVLSLRPSCPGLRLILVIPCADQSRHWPAAEKARWQALSAAADEVVVKSPSYYPGCMQVRNRFMVDRAQLCLCYLSSFRGGTFSTVRYAQRRGLPVLNLAMPLLERRRASSSDDPLLREAVYPYGTVSAYPLLPPKVPLLRFRLLSGSGGSLGTLRGPAAPGGRPAFRGPARPSPLCRNRLYRRRHALDSAAPSLLPPSRGPEDQL